MQIHGRQDDLGAAGQQGRGHERAREQPDQTVTPDHRDRTRRRRHDRQPVATADAMAHRCDLANGRRSMPGVARLRHLIFALLGVTLAVLLASGTSARAAESDGRLFGLSGDVRLNGQPIQGRTPVRSGDLIETAGSSTAKLILRDRTVLDIRPSTKFRVEKFHFDRVAPRQSSSSFSLLTGALRYVSGVAVIDFQHNGVGR